MVNLLTLETFISLVEGPYKAYILIGAVALLALFFTRFIFKTIKWILLVVAIGILGALIIKYLSTH